MAFCAFANVRVLRCNLAVPFAVVVSGADGPGTGALTCGGGRLCLGLRLGTPLVNHGEAENSKLYG